MPFTMKECRALAPVEQEAVQEVAYTLNGRDDIWKILNRWDDEHLTEALALLVPAGGCVPDGYEENLDQNIIRKLYGVYGTGRSLAELAVAEAGGAVSKTDPIRCTISPSVEGCSAVVIHDDSRVYYRVDRNAWGVGYDDLRDLVDAILEV